jgi:hypothetical protein
MKHKPLIGAKDLSVLMRSKATTQSIKQHRKRLCFSARPKTMLGWIWEGSSLLAKVLEYNLRKNFSDYMRKNQHFGAVSAVDVQSFKGKSCSCKHRPLKVKLNI